MFHKYWNSQNWWFLQFYCGPNQTLTFGLMVQTHYNLTFVFLGDRGFTMNNLLIPVYAMAVAMALVPVLSLLGYYVS